MEMTKNQKNQRKKSLNLTIESLRNHWIWSIEITQMKEDREEKDRKTFNKLIGTYKTILKGQTYWHTRAEKKMTPPPNQRTVDQKFPNFD